MNWKLLITLRLTFFVVLLFSQTSCEKLMPDRVERMRSEGDAAAKRGEHVAALTLYEKALDNTPEGAVIHFKMALICETKLNDPISAYFHYRRCARIAPRGQHAQDAKTACTRLEAAVQNALSDGPPLSKKDAVILKNENIALRQQIIDLKEQIKTMASLARLRKGDPTTADKMATPSPETIRRMGGRTYVVEPGDTFPLISKKVYGSKGRAQDIQDANINTVPDPKKLKIGQTLIIPQ